MSKRMLPAAPEAAPRAGLSCEVSPFALARWNPEIRAAVANDDTTISMLDPIGFDPWGEGVTAKRIAGALRAIGGRDVTVYVNSPGGDLFEGIAIYNQLREYRGKVTVKVLGVAASAASFIAMAGDEIQIASSAFFMIHNAHVVVAGNRLDLCDVTNTLETFDAAMADIYAARTGQDVSALRSMMDAETWMAGKEAVARGFADALFDSDVPSEADTDGARARLASRQVDALLARQGMPRAERQRLLRDMQAGTPFGTDPAVSAQSIADLQGALSRLASVGLNPSSEM